MKRLLTVAGLALAMSAPALAAPSPMPMHSMMPKHKMCTTKSNKMMNKKTTNPAVKTGPGVGAMSGKPVSPAKASGPNGAPSHSP